MSAPRTPPPAHEDPRPEWVGYLEKNPLLWRDFLEWLNTLDKETISKYDTSKDTNDLLRAQGGRHLILSIKNRITKVVP